MNKGVELPITNSTNKEEVLPSPSKSEQPKSMPIEVSNKESKETGESNSTDKSMKLRNEKISGMRNC